MKQVYINGALVAAENAMVSAFDRGFLFADAVYEVTSVIHSKLIDFPRHLERLQRSLSELDIDYVVNSDELLAVHKKLIRVNELNEGVVYLQISRGAGARDFLIDNQAQPTVVAFTQEKQVVRQFASDYRFSIITLEDQRWGRCDIKTVQLLSQSLAKTRAVDLGADDAWMTRDGWITEGTSSNAFIVIDDTVITRQLGSNILPGITRRSVLECADELGLAVEERAFSVAEAIQASEAFTTSAAGLVTPVTTIDSQLIGDGKPGEVALSLSDIYLRNCLQSAL